MVHQTFSRMLSEINFFVIVCKLINHDYALELWELSKGLSLLDASVSSFLA